MKSLPDTLPKFLWYFAKRYKGYLLGLVAVAIFWGSNISLTPYAMKLMIDSVSSWDGTGSLYSSVLYPAALYIGLNIGVGLLFRLYDWLALHTFPSMEVEVTEEVFGYIEQHSYSYFQHNFAGSLGNKINDISKGTSKIIRQLIDYFFARAVGLFIGIYTMFTVHPAFAVALLTWSIIFLLTSYVLSKKAKGYAERYSEARSVAVGKVVDSLSNILTVKLFAREGYERRQLHGYLDTVQELGKSGEWYLLKVKTFYTFTISALTAVMVGLLIYERAHNHVTVGDFALILTLNMFLIEELFFVANELVDFSELLGTSSQALKVLSTKLSIVDKVNAKPLVITEGKISFEKVNFTYKKNSLLFKEKSLIIHPGESVGLVGYSGSGKSTLVNLILRFFDIESGKIRIDDQDIAEVTQESLRSQVAMIPQDPLLFHRSLYDNILYGRPDATYEEVIECSKKAHCHEFALKLPQGYNSLVGERGIKLSGGQRQRIAIARAMLKNARILILDEATSALDSVTENYIQEGLFLTMKGRTTIVIAHRLSTLVHMDRIIVFHEGNIVEDGPHKELIQQNGHYVKLWSMQAKGFL